MDCSGLSAVMLNNNLILLNGYCFHGLSGLPFLCVSSDHPVFTVKYDLLFYKRARFLPLPRRPQSLGLNRLIQETRPSEMKMILIGNVPEMCASVEAAADIQGTRQRSGTLERFAGLCYDAARLLRERPCRCAVLADASITETGGQV